jgi:hypothetical protein
MSRVFLDDNLLSWEAYASGGKYGLAVEPQIVFHCLSDRSLRPRYVRHGEDNAGAEHAVRSLSDGELREMLRDADDLS